MRQELASAEQRRADRLEVAVADVEHLRTGRIVSRTKDEARRQESDALAGTANRNVLRRADTQDAGNRPYLVDHVAIKLLIVLVTRRAHREIYDQQSLGTKARVDVEKAHEAARHQSGADDEHDGEGDLGHDERVAQSLTKTPGETATAFAQRALQRGRRDAKRWYESEQQSRQH